MAGKQSLTVDEVVNLLCQFPGDTQVIICPNYESGGRQMLRLVNAVQILDDEKQPAFIGLTTDGESPKRAERQNED